MLPTIIHILLTILVHFLGIACVKFFPLIILKQKKINIYYIASDTSNCLVDVIVQQLKKTVILYYNILTVILVFAIGLL
uniref:7TM GPCR serpentine receptor class x (Srx) domain-containing protein n=1 Tax=Syphacia muris TaxID=451379 RepID=A0A0N5B080_9BILA